VLRKTPMKALLIATLLLVPMFAAPDAAQAQWRRGPRVVVVGGPVFSHYYYDPFFFYDPFFEPQWYPYPYPPPFPYRRYDDSASVRVQVKPKDAEVYVDGYYAGLVDDFDGVFQRLNLPPGQHDIEVHKDGFKTVRQQIYLSPRSTYKLHYDMQPLAPGEMADPRPMPPAPPPGAQGPPMPPQYGPGGQPGPPPQRMPPGRRMPPPPPQNPPQGPGDASRFGTVLIRVQPGGADIMIDGERWRGPEGQDRLVVQLAEGSHRVEIEKDGYQRYSSDIQVRRGETTPLNVSLPPVRQ
jgi:PEGA domain-containing protein